MILSRVDRSESRDGSISSVQNQEYQVATRSTAAITEHHSQLCTKLFEAIVADPDHKLHGLLPQKNNVVYNFRYNRPFVLPCVHTNRGSEWGSVFSVICPKFLVFTVKLAIFLMFIVLEKNTV